MTCIFTIEDALAAQREAYTFQQNQAAASSANGLNAGAGRRPSLQPQTNGLGGMSGLGGAPRQSRSGLTFDHIINRIQGELQKSRDTGAELGAVANTMGDIENVIGGGQPPNLPPHPHVLPPVRPPPQQAPQMLPQVQTDSDSPSIALQTLQGQLAETQASLTTNVEKIRTLEALLSDHDNIKREVNALRELIEEERERHNLAVQHAREDDDDDRRSIHTVVPHELEAVPEEDEAEAEESEEERHARREELGRPRTPEPTSLGMHEEDYERDHRGMQHPQPPGIPEELADRLAMLSDQLEAALELSRNLHEQHVVAQQTINGLENKVNALEEQVSAAQAAKAAEEAKRAEEAEVREQAQQNSVINLLAEFRKTMEERWDSAKLEWEAERERMQKERGEWESRVKSLEDGVSNVSSKFELGLAGLAGQLAGMKANGHIVAPVKHKGGLVTPPSPRSLSEEDSDSDGPLKGGKGRRRSRSLSHSRRATRLSKPNSRSRSPATSTSATLVDSVSSAAASEQGTDSSIGSEHSRRSSSPNGVIPGSIDTSATQVNRKFSSFLPTPQSSIHIEDGSPVEMKAMQPLQASLSCTITSQFYRMLIVFALLKATPVSNSQVAIGVFVLGVVAGAVLWRVKE